jgi:hypothetical protein
VHFKANTGTVICAVKFIAVSLTLLQSMFRIQPINCYDMKNTLAEINLNKLRDKLAAIILAS